jgi:hypothetical protein
MSHASRVQVRNVSRGTIIKKMESEKRYIEVGGRRCPLLCDNVKIGNWEEVQGLPVSTITKRDGDDALLDGLIVKGYEMEWGATNENGERYSQEAFDEFIDEYFVGRGLNLVVDIEHAGEHSPEWVAGRVIYAETNSRGFYFVAYIPRSYCHYDMVRSMLAEGLLQGFSKMGYATDWEVKYTENGEFDYELIKSFKLFAVSLVSAPANGVAFEKVAELKRDGLTFVKNIENASGSELERMFARSK